MGAPRFMWFSDDSVAGRAGAVGADPIALAALARLPPPARRAIVERFGPDGFPRRAASSLGTGGTESRAWLAGLLESHPGAPFPPRLNPLGRIARAAAEMAREAAGRAQVLETHTVFLDPPPPPLLPIVGGPGAGDAAADLLRRPLHGVLGGVGSGPPEGVHLAPDETPAGVGGPPPLRLLLHPVSEGGGGGFPPPRHVADLEAWCRDRWPGAAAGRAPRGLRERVRAYLFAVEHLGLDGACFGAAAGSDALVACDVLRRRLFRVAPGAGASRGAADGVAAWWERHPRGGAGSAFH